MEIQFADAFLRSTKRERFVALSEARTLSRSSGRKTQKLHAQYRQALVNLEHWISTDESIVREHRSDPSEGLLQALQEAGAPAECYAMSVDPALDGRTLPVDVALSALKSGLNDTTLLLHRPASLIYYWHGEWHNSSMILMRRAPR